MSALIRLSNRALINNIITQSRLINTSQKHRDTSVPTTGAPSSVEDFKKPKKENWVSYGFDFYDKDNDRASTRASFFMSISLCIVWGTFIWAYIPDARLKDWAVREAFLEIRRREAAGLEFIDPNYVDPSAIELPSDEELGDTEIII